MTDGPEAPQPITTPLAEEALAAHGTDPWVHRDFRLLWLGRLCAVLAIQIQSTAVLWQVLDIARVRGASVEQAALYTGAVGFVQFLPLLILTLPAGEMADRRDRRLTVLASIGATAPFVGLLGTVWGIYHALANVSASGDMQIDKVAGPVGEALVMTAVGLTVAIPAVLAYNGFNRVNRLTLAELDAFAHDLHAYLTKK